MAESSWGRRRSQGQQTAFGGRAARHYVAFAEAANGPIPVPVPPEYPWGDAIAVLETVRPDVRIVNLETSITTSGAWCREKEIHYRMHPANVDCLTAAGIDVCTLANNHTLDWGIEGLVETLDSLCRAGIQTAGAGRTAAEAARPAVVAGRAPGRVLVWAVGSGTSGIPLDWQATCRRASSRLPMG